MARVAPGAAGGHGPVVAQPAVRGRISRTAAAGIAGAPSRPAPGPAAMARGMLAGLDCPDSKWCCQSDGRSGWAGRSSRRPWRTLASSMPRGAHAPGRWLARSPASGSRPTSSSPPPCRRLPCPSGSIPARSRASGAGPQFRLTSRLSTSDTPLRQNCGRKGLSARTTKGCDTRPNPTAPRQHSNQRREVAAHHREGGQGRSDWDRFAEGQLARYRRAR
jgi:hypothetical protein